MQDLATDRELHRALDAAALETLERFGPGGLTADRLGCSAIDVTRRGHAHVLGDSAFYPASVVKAFYLVYAYERVDSGALVLDDELERALTDMIRDSSNDATHTVMDYVTGTTGGPWLHDAAEFGEFAHRRNAVNRWFESLGYRGHNLNQKTWCEGPYGRERQFVRSERGGRNSLCANHASRLLFDLATGRFARSSDALEKLRRATPADEPEADFQARAFIGGSIPAGCLLWSKAGYTSDSRHDAALVEFPNGQRIALAVFTRDNSNQTEAIGFLASRFWSALGLG